jgi:hypothetical protein
MIDESVERFSAVGNKILTVETYIFREKDVARMVDQVTEEYK